MKEQKSLPVRRRRHRRHRRVCFRLFLRVVFITGCFAVLLSMTGRGLCKENFRDELVSGEMFLDEMMPEDSAIKSDDLLTDTAPKETENTDTLWYLTLVNDQNPLPENDQKETIHLVDVPGGEKVDERIYAPLMEMMDAAAHLGPIVVSGYRTWEKQQSLYDDKIREYRVQGYSEKEAVELAQQWVAVPGTSEHQLGIAVDINGDTYDIYLWLQENSYRYGFIFRYPGNKTDITGVAEEVWHYRYVGKEAAEEIHNRGICLEEYLENP